MTDFSVRAARPADHLALADLLAEVLGQPQLAPVLAPSLNTNLLRLLSAPGAALLVAEVAGTTEAAETAEAVPGGAAKPEEALLLGFVSLWTCWGLLDEAPSGFIDRIVVRRGWQDRAVPHALLEQALGVCQAMGCAEVDFVPVEASLVPEASLAAFGFRRVQQGRFSLSVL